MKIKNLKQFDENSAYFAELESKLRKKQAAFDEKEAQRREKFTKDNKVDLDNLEGVKEALLDYAQSNQKELFATKKTYKNEHISVSMKTSEPLDIVGGSKKESNVIEKIKTNYKKFSDRFIKTTEKVDKAVINSAIKSQEIDGEFLKSVGLKKYTKQNFTIKPL